jgi:hypothetical protein
VGADGLDGSTDRTSYTLSKYGNTSKKWNIRFVRNNTITVDAEVEKEQGLDDGLTVQTKFHNNQ